MKYIEMLSIFRVVFNVKDLLNNNKVIVRLQVPLVGIVIIQIFIEPIQILEI